MSRLLENRVARLEGNRRADKYADWTDEQLVARIAELDAVITRGGRITIEEAVARCDDLNESEKAHLLSLHQRVAV